MKRFSDAERAYIIQLLRRNMVSCPPVELKLCAELVTRLRE